MKTAAFRKMDPTCFATGGRDNAILIWDIRSRSHAGSVPKADNCIMSGHTGGPGTPAANRRRQTRQTPRTPSNVPSNSITGLVFQVSAMRTCPLYRNNNNFDFQTGRLHVGIVWRRRWCHQSVGSTTQLFML